MTMLVTGGSGFLGRNLIRALLARGHEVRALHRRDTPPLKAPGLTWHQHNLDRPTAWAPLLDGVSHVFHLAWSTLPQSSNDDPAADAVTNIGGSLSLLEALRGRALERIVFASSGGTVYGAVPTGRAAEDNPKRPLSAYGVSKLAVENYLALYERQWGVPSVALRLANPFGPDQELGRNFGVVATFAAQALAGKACTIFGDGAVERDFIYVDDAIAALMAAATSPSAHGPYNVGSGEGRSIASVLQSLEAMLGHPIETTYAPQRLFDPPRTVLDAGRAATDLNWRPVVPFEQGLKFVVEGHRANGRRP